MSLDNWSTCWYHTCTSIHVNMYLNICTYMSQQMQLMYTETPCFGENRRNQKNTQNTQKYIFRRATKATISKFRGSRRKKNRASRGCFWWQSQKQMMRTFNYLLLGTLTSAQGSLVPWTPTLKEVRVRVRGRGQPMSNLVVRKSGLTPTKQK